MGTRQIQHANVKLTNYKMGDPFHSSRFFFFFHEEGWLQDFFLGLLELFNMIMRRYACIGYGSGFWMEVAGFVTQLRAVKTCGLFSVSLPRFPQF